MNKKIVIAVIIVALLIITGIIIDNYRQIPENVEPYNSNNVNQVNNIDDNNKNLIKVSPIAYDFGKVTYGQVVKHTFTISNNGKKNLEILKLSTSCGCTKADIADEDKVIRPGQSIEMLVNFDPAVHKDDADLGQVTRIVYIKTNDPENPEVEVEIQANVVKEKIIK